MIHQRSIPVRQHQAWVLASLHMASRPVTPAEIADHLNSRAGETLLPPTDQVDVEASIAALMLRPSLRPFLTFKTRSASPVEKRARRRMGLGSIASVVVLSACATAGPAQSPNPVTIHSYFGNVRPVQKAEPPPTRVSFTGVNFLGAYDSAISMTGSSESMAGSFAEKTVAVVSSNGSASYFDTDSPARTFVARAESTFAPADFLITAEPSIQRPAARAPIIVAELSPVLPKLAMALSASRESASTVASSPSANPPASPARAAGAALDPKLPTAIHSAINLPALQPSIVNVPVQKLNLGDTPRTDLYTDLVTFSNSAVVLSPSSPQRVQALVAAAKSADSIQLRGRFGNHTLTPETARVALSRAIAVRAAMVAQGIPKSKIRIHMPRDNDLLVQTDFSNEKNRSVSIFMTMPPSVAAHLRLSTDKPIAHLSAPT